MLDILPTDEEITMNFGSVVVIVVVVVLGEVDASSKGHVAWNNNKCDTVFTLK